MHISLHEQDYKLIHPFIYCLEIGSRGGRWRGPWTGSCLIAEEYRVIGWCVETAWFKNSYRSINGRLARALVQVVEGK